MVWYIQCTSMPNNVCINPQQEAHFKMLYFKWHALKIWIIWTHGGAMTLRRSLDRQSRALIALSRTVEVKRSSIKSAVWWTCLLSFSFPFLVFNALKSFYKLNWRGWMAGIWKYSKLLNKMHLPGFYQDSR